MKCKKRRFLVVTLVILLIVMGSRAEAAYDFEMSVAEITCKKNIIDFPKETFEKEDIAFHDCEPSIKKDPIKRKVKSQANLKRKYKIPKLENNSIYIVGTDIKEGFTISSFTQSAVDTYDIVYTEQTKLGPDNPFVLGHRYGTLGILYQTKVGEYIYLNVNGKIEIYEVVVSEYGLQNSSKSDIIGQTTGTSIWHNYNCKTLHMYTCYGNDKNGRWIVLAIKIF